MNIDRRKFLVSTGLAATAPALAGLLSLPAIAQLSAAQSPEPALSAGEANVRIDTSGVVFGIDGWGLGDNSPDANMVLISVNQSWRSAWR